MKKQILLILSLLSILFLARGQTGFEEDFFDDAALDKFTLYEWEQSYQYDEVGNISCETGILGMATENFSYGFDAEKGNPANQTAYAPDTEPALFLGRGYTGHEHLAMFGLVNMNARLYDPAVGRFLSPDPYVQAPDFSQNFNRYSYALNNPLLYVDPDGELVWLIPMVAGGIINWATHGCKFTWEGLSYFGVGALAGASTLIGGTLAPALAGGITGAGNSFVSQGFAGGNGNTWNGSKINWGQVGIGGISGAITGYLGGKMADKLTPYVSQYVSELIGSPVLQDMVTNSLVGGATGAFSGYQRAKAKEVNPWTGNPKITVTAEDLGLSSTMDRIKNGQSYPHKNDGTTFKNREGILPVKSKDYYKEYVHPTSGTEGPGLQRIIIGKRGEHYYSQDHYTTFIRFKLK